MANASTKEPLFDVHADGVDVDALVADIQAAAGQKMRSGVYRGAGLVSAERANLPNLQKDGGFFQFYLDCLRQSVCVDINDFEIAERRRPFGFAVVALKKVLWKLLKFYTYRLWSQQNEANSLLLSAIEGLDEKYRDRIRELEERVAGLESRTGKNP